MMPFHLGIIAKIISLIIILWIFNKASNRMKIVAVILFIAWVTLTASYIHDHWQEQTHRMDEVYEFHTGKSKMP